MSPRKSAQVLSYSLAVVALLSSSVTGAASLRHGCGYRLVPGAKATWWSFGRPTNPATRITIDQVALPWGATGSGALSNALYIRRYAGGNADLLRLGGMTPQGEANERAWHTASVLAKGCQDGLFGSGWDCSPTRIEIEDYAFTVQRGTGLYQRYACLFTASGCPRP